MIKHDTNLWTFVLRPKHAACEGFWAMTPCGFVTPRRRIREDLNIDQRCYKNIKSLMLFVPPPFPPFAFYPSVKNFPHQKYFEWVDSSVNSSGVFGRYAFRMLSGFLDILRCSLWPLSSFSQMAGVIFQIRRWPLLSKQFPFIHSLIMLWVVWVRELLNKS